MRQAVVARRPSDSAGDDEGLVGWMARMHVVREGGARRYPPESERRDAVSQEEPDVVAAARSIAQLDLVELNAVRAHRRCARDHEPDPPLVEEVEGVLALVRRDAVDRHHGAPAPVRPVGRVRRGFDAVTPGAAVVGLIVVEAAARAPLEHQSLRPRADVERDPCGLLGARPPRVPDCPRIAIGDARRSSVRH